jgi:hypothetical protein
VRRFAGSEPKVFGGTQAAEFAEVMIEVRLIGNSHGRAQVVPVDIGAAADRMYHLLEPFNPVEKFWRHSHFGSKEFNESPLAESDFSHNVRACVEAGFLFEVPRSRMSLPGDVVTADWQSQEPSLEGEEFSFDRWRFVQHGKEPFRASFTPQVGEADVGV